VNLYNFSTYSNVNIGIAITLHWEITKNKLLKISSLFFEDFSIIWLF
jgi:hypothetical protein